MKALAEGIELAKMKNCESVKIQGPDQSESRGSGIWAKPRFSQNICSPQEVRGDEDRP